MPYHEKMKNKSASAHPGLKFAKGGDDTISVSEFKNMVETEASLQSQIDIFLQFYPDIWSIRIPDNFWRLVYALKNSALQAMLGKIFGGMPDNVLVRKGVKYNSCLMTEQKVKGRKLRQNQKKWASVLNVYKIESFEDFQKVFEEWYK